jgi:cytoskeletal protein CcmA (bactofilin family)
MARAKKGVRRTVRCYLCGTLVEVSARTMSTTCPGCHKAIKVEDILIKSYMPVNDVQTTGKIRITRRGRVAARKIQSGESIACEGSLEGSIETDGGVVLGSQASWKGPLLQCRTLSVAEGATLVGRIRVPWVRDER